jgi:haloacid dehalogenase-like hydrolase
MPNDITMFKKSGLSIAMGNASSEVQEAATCVTASNQEEGFAIAVGSSSCRRRMSKRLDGAKVNTPPPNELLIRMKQCRSRSEPDNLGQI